GVAPLLGLGCPRVTAVLDLAKVPPLCALASAPKAAEPGEGGGDGQERRARWALRCPGARGHDIRVPGPRPRRAHAIQPPGSQPESWRPWSLLWRCPSAAGQNAVLGAVDVLGYGVAVLARGWAVPSGARALQPVRCPL